MAPAQSQARHAELAEQIRRHDHAYYVEAKPVISDQEYDRLYHELLDLEKGGKKEVLFKGDFDGFMRWLKKASEND